MRRLLKTSFFRPSCFDSCSSSHLLDRSSHHLLSPFLSLLSPWHPSSWPSPVTELSQTEAVLPSKPHILPKPNIETKRSPVLKEHPLKDMDLQLLRSHIFPPSPPSASLSASQPSQKPSQKPFQPSRSPSLDPSPLLSSHSQLSLQSSPSRPRQKPGPHL